jgi:hypothetical protein
MTISFVYSQQIYSIRAVMPKGDALFWQAISGVAKAPQVERHTLERLKPETS